MDIYAIMNGKITTPIAKHVGLQHNFDLSVLQLTALENIPESERGGVTGISYSCAMRLTGCIASK